jgi:hypothetical protein
MNRIVLMNTTYAPDRKALTTSERTTGDLFLAPLGLEYGGYEIIEGVGKMAARWMVPDSKITDVIEFAASNSLEGYKTLLYIKDPAASE